MCPKRRGRSPRCSLGYARNGGAAERGVSRSLTPSSTRRAARRPASIIYRSRERCRPQECDRAKSDSWRGDAAERETSILSCTHCSIIVVRCCGSCSCFGCRWPEKQRVPIWSGSMSAYHESRRRSARGVRGAQVAEEEVREIERIASNSPCSAAPRTHREQRRVMPL